MFVLLFNFDACKYKCIEISKKTEIFISLTTKKITKKGSRSLRRETFFERIQDSFFFQVFNDKLNSFFLFLMILLFFIVGMTLKSEYIWVMFHPKSEITHANIYMCVLESNLKQTSLYRRNLKGKRNLDQSKYWNEAWITN